ncbi:adhesive plaque matrix protein-like [Galleria mellonella]|uniref:Adhesive plaque matrix protein-like n=1 Tax=Galleria mellonella TaxID=7137 RepID=A0ABM3MS55_GALME|nr:adhesive plaque matrix protein-like [Galleria mellonella]
MLVGFTLNMLCILILCPVLLVAVQTLTIDSQLGTSIEDCFERISIGEQLPPSGIYRNVSELTTRECEQICKQDKQCQTYDYGVGAKGNATCNLSDRSEKELKEQNLLQRHPDYDVYVRRIQCEQSPPTPIQGQFDDPDAGPGGVPAHRPVFRPDEDDFKRPLSDEFPGDLRPYETARPPYLNAKPGYPQISNDRPDDYSSSKPDNDVPPSYGDHKPQDIPYKPDKPYHNQPHQKPDPYDVLQFQDPYRPGRPPDHGYWRPDPHYPSHPGDDIPDLYGQRPVRPNRPYDFPVGLPPYHPEKPEYHYIIRPNRKPRPQDDNGYGFRPKPQDYPTKPDLYGQNDIGHPSGPIGPPDRPPRPNRPHYDYPYRPYDRPSYSYNSQYASSYGQNSHDNSIYLEIFDPPRPYKPYKPLSKPDHDYGPGGYGQDIGYGVQGYGYGNSHSQSSYSQSHSSQSHYGTGTITEIDHDNNYIRPPQDAGYRPQKPHYDKPGYGPAPDYVMPSGGYGVPSKPSQPEKPYGSNQGYGSQSSYSDNSQSDHSTSQAYGSTSESYGSSNSPSYGNQDNYGSKPGYGLTTTQKPIYGYNKPDHEKPYSSNHGSYTSNSQSYSSTQEEYNSHHSYETSQSGYGIKPSYTEEKPYGNRPSYGNKPYDDNKRPPYGNNRPTYDENRPPFNDKPIYSDKPSYSGNSPSYGEKPYNDNKRPGYNDPRPPYSDNQSSYGSNKPYNDNKRPAYGDNDNQPSYTGNKPPYNDNKPTYGSNDNPPSYGGNIPSYNGNKRPSYSDNNDQPSYGGNKPSYNDNKRPSYGDSDNRPSYADSKPPNDNKRPPYGDNRPSYGDNPPYSGNRPPYGDRPSYSDRPSYGDDRPDPAYEGGSNSYDGSGYGDYKYTGHKKPGYGSRPNGTGYPRPDIKPVYEYEMDRPMNVPSYIVRPSGDVVTSRPVTIGDYGERGYHGPGRISYKVKACEFAGNNLS